MAIILGIGIPGLIVLAHDDSTHYPVLAPCARLDHVYDDLDFDSKSFKEWQETYHATVDGIVEEYLDDPTIDCSAETPRELVPVEDGTELYKLAEKLPPWKDPDEDDDDEATIGQLSRSDIGLVLLEHLRIYECALQAHTDVLEFDLAAEKAREEAIEKAKKDGLDHTDEGVIRSILDSFRESFLQVSYPDLTKEGLQRRSSIDRELDVARTALHRTLTLIGAYDRFKPLEAEFECMQRMSLDIRNVTSLAAEASACLPRVWNARGPLRNPN